MIPIRWQEKIKQDEIAEKQRIAKQKREKEQRIEREKELERAKEIKIKKDEGEKNKDRGEVAIKIAEIRIRRLLKAPSTAVFFPLGYKREENQVYNVAGDVDSQNSFGAMLRTSYVFTLQYTGGDEDKISNWKFLYGVLGDQVFY